MLIEVGKTYTNAAGHDVFIVASHPTFIAAVVGVNMQQGNANVWGISGDPIGKDAVRLVAKSEDTNESKKNRPKTEDCAVS